MNGVDILAVEEVAVDWCWSWSVFWKFFAIGLGACIIGWALATLFEQDWWAGILVGLLCGVIIGLFLGILAGRDGMPIKFEDHYKVTISDEVSTNEFNNRYEILKQDGLIFTIRERSSDE